MLKVEVDPNLARALSALSAAESGTQEAMRASAAGAIDRTWSVDLAAASGTEAEARMLSTGATAEVGPASFSLTAGIGNPLSGGLDTDQWYALEYGMVPQQIEAPKRRKKVKIAGSGRVMSVVTRVWVGRNLKPRNRDGYVIFPTIRQNVPRYVEAWIEGLIGQFDPVDGTALDIKR